MWASNSAAQVSTVFMVARTPGGQPGGAHLVLVDADHSQASWASEKPSRLARRQSARLQLRPGRRSAAEPGPLVDDQGDLVEEPRVDPGGLVQPLDADAPPQGRLQLEGPVGGGDGGPAHQLVVVPAVVERLGRDRS